MSWFRIYALIARHTLPLKRDFDLLSDLLYWPLIDAITWGITTEWLTQSDSDAGQFVLTVLVGLIIWQVIWRSQSEVSRNLIDEMWNNNLLNMFSSPLKLSEWVTSVLLQSVVKMLVAVSCIAGFMYLLYTVNVFTIGVWVIPFFINAVMTGWAIGFVAASIVIRYGPKMQTVVWTLPAVLFPLSAVFFPVSQLPEFVQPLSLLVPTTYIFESMRELVFNGTVPMEYIWYSVGYNILYLGLAVWLFVGRFKTSKKLNLARFNN